MDSKTVNVLQIKMFGNFEITYKDKVLCSEEIRSEMAELLLIYIVSHYKKDITMQEVCETLWGDDESDNPIGALKNLMYRLRTLLKKTWDDDFILTGRGIYQWNPEIKVSLDTDRFDMLVQNSTDEKTNKNIKLLEEAASLYANRYLVKHTKHHWILQQAFYYQSQFATIVKKLSQIYIFQSNFEQLEVLCNKALHFDPYDESVHYTLIFAYIKQGKKKIALDHYRNTTKMLYEELGTQVSKDLQSLYTQILQQDNSTEMDLGNIQHDLNEALQPKGAFLCEYGVFKEIYRLQSRQASRMGMSIYCALLSVHIRLDIPAESDMYKRLIKKAIEALQGMLTSTLRTGDCVARYSVSQFVLLLPTCTYESSIIVMERLMSKFKELNTVAHIELSYDVRELPTQKEKVTTNG